MKVFLHFAYTKCDILFYFYYAFDRFINYGYSNVQYELQY